MLNSFEFGDSLVMVGHSVVALVFCLGCRCLQGGGLYLVDGLELAISNQINIH